ncbi:MAG: hypothetical protein M1538_01430 [Candidatus Marsarchaeota archaeon]|jgi:hypothetical protein|nr:hypothetical protein [Candidatus Marsarchaeota archaeon]
MVYKYKATKKSKKIKQIKGANKNQNKEKKTAALSKKYKEEINAIDKTDKIGIILKASALENLAITDPDAGLENSHMNENTIDSIISKAHREIAKNNKFFKDIENMTLTKKKKNKK